jgi:hypothetical protein
VRWPATKVIAGLHVPDFVTWSWPTVASWSSGQRWGAGEPDRDVDQVGSQGGPAGHGLAGCAGEDVGGAQQVPLLANRDRPVTLALPTPRIAAVARHLTSRDVPISVTA